VIRSAELQGAEVRTESGRRLGKVREIHVRDGEVTALVCGGGFLQRFAPSRRGHRVRWERVRRITGRAIVVADGPGR
jgi:sporulation protein YlmC with PRC-barrel domain